VGRPGSFFGGCSMQASRLCRPAINSCRKSNVPPPGRQRFKSFGARTRLNE
jgi:hypothetical protein